MDSTWKTRTKTYGRKKNVVMLLCQNRVFRLEMTSFVDFVDLYYH